MSQVTINQSLDVWVLCISINGQVLSTYTRSRLIDAIGVASELQLHVSNINELPLNQYLQGLNQNETI